MLRLCFYKDWRGDQYDFMYDFSGKSVYRVFHSGDVISEGNSRLLIVMSFTGVFTTVIESCLKGVFVNFSNYYVLSLLLLLVLVYTIVSLLFGISIRKQEEKIRLSENKIEYDLQDLIELFSGGTKVRVLMLIFIVVFLLVVLVVFEWFLQTHSLLNLVLLLMGIFALAIFVRLLSPIQIIKFKLYLRRCKKECQKK